MKLYGNWRAKWRGLTGIDIEIQNSVWKMGLNSCKITGLPQAIRNSGLKN